jgi:hypothetical protein
MDFQPLKKIAAVFQTKLLRQGGNASRFVANPYVAAFPPTSLRPFKKLARLLFEENFTTGKIYSINPDRM